MGRVLSVALFLILATVCATSSSRPGTSGPEATPAIIVSSAPRSATPSVEAPSKTAVESGTVTIQMGDHFYSPALVAVAVGTTVVWKNVGQNLHDVSSYDGSFSTPLLGFGGTYSYTFRKLGRYPYLCTAHAGDGMIGEVDVVLPG